MALPKLPKKNYRVKSSYEDMDASMPAASGGSQSEVKVKPIPLPRSKSQPKTESNTTTNSTVDSVNTYYNTANEVSSLLNEYPADYRRTCPVRPPPRPPMSKWRTSSKPTAAVDRSNHYMSSITESTVKPPAVSTGETRTPPPPRPPPPSIYYERPPTMRLKSELYTDESQKSRSSTISSTRHTPVSPAPSKEMASDSTDRPVIPPRLRQSSLPRSATMCETSPPQTRPPPPAFRPPPPPLIGTPSESVYSEIDYPPYLTILPEDEDIMEQCQIDDGRSTLRSGQKHQRGSTEGTEDINAMLRWLKRVSKSDSMAPSLYGLSIEEEIRLFNERAMNVQKALRLYNLLMMKRKESLRDLITEFSSISCSLDKMKKKTKTMGIAGGTTGAVGGVTAVLGIALAPMTMGASLIATAVGAGIVASAGGMGAHTAKANKKIVDRKRVEKLVYDYKENIVDLEHCLDFTLTGMNELRRHDIARLQRAGAQPDALKMAHLSQSVIGNNNDKRASVTHTGGMSSEKLLQAFAKEMDQYFTENKDQKLKESNKSRFSGRVSLLAENLQNELDHLTYMWQMFS